MLRIPQARPAAGCEESIRHGQIGVARCPPVASTCIGRINGINNTGQSSTAGLVAAFPYLHEEVRVDRL